MVALITIRSFKDKESAADVAARLTANQIPCTVLSNHSSLGSHAWLLVQSDHYSQAKRLLGLMSSAILKASTKVAPISDQHIPASAVALGERAQRGRWLWWLILLWPTGFGLGVARGVVSVLVCLAVVILINKAAFSCPCCRSLPTHKPNPNTTAECNRCGLRYPPAMHNKQLPQSDAH